jgi:hypothetical protein
MSSIVFSKFCGVGGGVGDAEARPGLYRLGLLCLGGFVCYKLGVALLKTRPRAAAVIPPRDDLAAAKGGAGDEPRNFKQRPLRVAFEKRPALTALLVGLVAVFAVSLPFLLELASVGSTSRFEEQLDGGSCPFA